MPQEHQQGSRFYGPILAERLKRAYHNRNHTWTANPDFSYAELCELSESDVQELLSIANGGSPPAKTCVDWEQVWDDPLFTLVAWRGLGELGKVESIRPLLKTAHSQTLRAAESNEFDWLLDVLPDVLAQFGQPAVPTLSDVALSAEYSEALTRSVVASLGKISEHEPECLPTIERVLVTLLERGTEETLDLNTDTMYALVKNQCSEAAELIERQFSLNRIDIGTYGDWEAMRQELGVEQLGLPMPAHPHDCMRDFRERAGVCCFSNSPLFIPSDPDADEHIQQYLNKALSLFRASREGATAIERGGDLYWTRPFLEIAAENGLTVNTLSSDTVPKVFSVVLGTEGTHEQFTDMLFELYHFWKFVDRVFALRNCESIVQLLSLSLEDGLQVSEDTTPSSTTRGSRRRRQKQLASAMNRRKRRR